MKNKPRLSFSLLCFLSLICSHCNCAKNPPSYNKEKQLNNSDNKEKEFNNSEVQSKFSVSIQPNSPAGNTSENAIILEESVESEEEQDQEENVDPSTLIDDDMVKRGSAGRRGL